MGFSERGIFGLQAEEERTRPAKATGFPLLLPYQCVSI